MISSLFSASSNTLKDYYKPVPKPDSSAPVTPALTPQEKRQADHLMVVAWIDNMLSARLADSASFRIWIDTISRGSYQMPHRTTITRIIDELYELVKEEG